MEFDMRRRRVVLSVYIEGAQQQSWSRHPPMVSDEETSRKAARSAAFDAPLRGCAAVCLKSRENRGQQAPKMEKAPPKQIGRAFDESSMLRAGRPRAGGGVQFQQRYGVQACGRRCRGEPERFFPKCRILQRLLYWNNPVPPCGSLRVRAA